MRGWGAVWNVSVPVRGFFDEEQKLARLTRRHLWKPRLLIVSQGKESLDRYGKPRHRPHSPKPKLALASFDTTSYNSLLTVRGAWG